MHAFINISVKIIMFLRVGFFLYHDSLLKHVYLVLLMIHLDSHLKFEIKKNNFISNNFNLKLKII